MVLTGNLKGFGDKLNVNKLQLPTRFGIFKNSEHKLFVTIAIYTRLKYFTTEMLKLIT